MTQAQKVSDSTATVRLMEMPNGGASDITLKKNTTEIPTALKDILALRPVTWHWKTDLHEEELQHGFIAQEVEKIFPSLVKTVTGDNGTTHKVLSTKDLIPYLVKALEEQQRQIDLLSQKVSNSSKK